MPPRYRDVSRRRRRKGLALLPRRKWPIAAIAEELGVERYGKFSGHIWEQIELPLVLKSHGYPLLVSLGNTGPLAYGRQVVVLHDVSFMRFPETYSFMFRNYYRFLVPRLIRKAVHIMTVSHFSKMEIKTLYGISPDKISVIYAAVSDRFSAGSTIDGREKYLLAVSSLKHQKNFERLIEAFGMIRNRDVKLVIVGDIDASYRDISLAEKVGAAAGVELLGRVSDEELIGLYRNAQAFIYPSLYEGFGLPPLEAMACGCPVVTANTASLPEVCGDAVCYVDPYDTVDISRGINQVLASGGLRSELREKGLKRVSLFRWDDSAARMLHLIEQFL